MLSRVIWPEYPVDEVRQALKKSSVLRVCIQTVPYPGYTRSLARLLVALKEAGKPVSVAITSVSRRVLQRLKDAGAERVGIGLDAASPKVFMRVKRGLTWSGVWRTIREALSVFGRGHVSCHLIAGLGESDLELTSTATVLVSMGCRVGLFALTPLPGTRMCAAERPSIERYRGLQLALYLIQEHGARARDFKFSSAGSLTGLGRWASLAESEAHSLRPFLTSGCPGCNRPFYNESPLGPIYNYPSLSLAKRDEDEIAQQVKRLLATC